MLKALIFDFDGLILDTETPEFEAWKAIFAAHGHEFPLDFYASFLGKGASLIEEWPLDRLARLTGGEIDRDSIERAYEQRRMQTILSSEILPGVTDLLADAKASGLKIGLASSSKHRWVDAHLERLGLLHYFETIACADDVERAKPFPDLYLLACANLGVQPHEALALEDSSNGSRAAQAAGVFVVVVPNPATSWHDLSHANARLESLAGVSVDAVRQLMLTSPA
ncbi:MAG: HAD family hydrolase [Fimbriimonas sp.]